MARDCCTLWSVGDVCALVAAGRNAICFSLQRFGVLVVAFPVKYSMARDGIHALSAKRSCHDLEFYRIRGPLVHQQWFLRTHITPALSGAPPITPKCTFQLTSSWGKRTKSQM